MRLWTWFLISSFAQQCTTLPCNCGGGKGHETTSLRGSEEKEVVRQPTVLGAYHQQVLADGKSLLHLLQQELLMLSLLTGALVKGEWLFTASPDVDLQQSRPTITHSNPLETEVVSSVENDLLATSESLGSISVQTTTPTPIATVTDPDNNHILYTPLPITTTTKLPPGEQLSVNSTVSTPNTTPYFGQYNPLAGDPYHLSFSSSATSPESSLDSQGEPLNFPVQYYKPVSAQTTPTPSSGSFNPLAQFGRPTAILNDQWW